MAAIKGKKLPQTAGLNDDIKDKDETMVERMIEKLEKAHEDIGDLVSVHKKLADQFDKDEYLDNHAHEGKKTKKTKASKTMQ